MCRIIAIPPMFPRDEAINILSSMLSRNTDGVGCAYIKNKEIVIQKYPSSLDEILKMGTAFLNHLPYSGWTIGHLRAASHGENTLKNTHPFEIGDWAILHNGIFSSHSLLRPLMESLPKIFKVEGQTDTEIAANYFNILGPKLFMDSIPSFSGVFVALNKKTYELHIVKSSGDLEMADIGDGVNLISSELSEKWNAEKNKEAGWYVFFPNGKLKKFTAKPTTTYSSATTYGGAYGSCGSRVTTREFKSVRENLSETQAWMAGDY